jgi:hypothetical protein
MIDLVDSQWQFFPAFSKLAGQCTASTIQWTLKGSGQTPYGSGDGNDDNWSRTGHSIAVEA